MTYSNLVKCLQENAEENFRVFQYKLIATKQIILGVRTPTMRKIAKEYSKDVVTLLSFPDEYYEVTFIKLSVISALPYKQFILHVEKCVSLMDNWATCDCFKAKYIRDNKDEFLPILERIFANGGEFYQRYALVTLLSDYVEEKYFPLIEEYCTRADTTKYYIHMATAWLLAEVLVKEYKAGIKLLQKGFLDKKTHNKAIQKAIESYRLTKEQKDYLRSLKIK